MTLLEASRDQLSTLNDALKLPLTINLDSSRTLIMHSGSLSSSAAHIRICLYSGLPSLYLPICIYACPLGSFLLVISPSLFRKKRPRGGVVFFPIGLKERGLVDDGAFYWAGGLGGVGIGFADGVACF